MPRLPVDRKQCTEQKTAFDKTSKKEKIAILLHSINISLAFLHCFVMRLCVCVLISIVYSDMPSDRCLGLSQ